MDKGTVSNLIAVFLLILGWLLPDGESGIRDLVRSAGLFAMSGGLTNTIAVKMLFDRVPGLIGSGVIEIRFKEIRIQIKRIILKNFFDRGDLKVFLEENKAEIDWTRYVQLGDGANPIASFIEANWERFTSKEAIGSAISSQVDKLMTGSFGGFLSMVGKGTIEDLVSGFVAGFAEEMKERVIRESESFELNPDKLGIDIDTDRLVDDLRDKVDTLLERKLQQLQPADVKEMMEEVIREHLGWLVVWGNVFGGMIGIISHFVSRAVS